MNKTREISTWVKLVNFSTMFETFFLNIAENYNESQYIKN